MELRIWAAYVTGPANEFVEAVSRITRFERKRNSESFFGSARSQHQKPSAFLGFTSLFALIL